MKTLVVLTCVVTASGVLSGQADKVATVFAAAHQALGGVAPLSSVQRFTATGTLTRYVGPRPSASAIEIYFVAGDKFTQVTRMTNQTPFGSFEVTRTWGFNGNQTFSRTAAPGAPFPVDMPPPPPANAADAVRRNNANHREFARLAAALFVSSSWDPYAVSFAAAGTASWPGGAAEIVEATGPDGWKFRIFFDPSTHLPVRVTWMAKPLVVAATSTVVTTQVTRGGRPMGPPQGAMPMPSLPAGDPTIGMADVEWETVFSDHRPTNGLAWPHRMVTSYEGKVFEDVKIERFQINPTIDPKVFLP
jgi:hypothetical protein